MVVPIKTGTKERNIIAREREQQAMILRKQGLTYRAIATKLEVTDVAVMKMVRKVLGRTMTITQEKAEEVRAIEIERCDALINAHWEYAMNGDEKSSAIILRVMDRRAAYLGLDAPKHIKVEEVSDIDRQLEALVERFKSGRQVQTTVEIDCTTEPDDAGGPMGRLALPCGQGVGENEDGSRG